MFNSSKEKETEAKQADQAEQEPAKDKAAKSTTTKKSENKKASPAVELAVLQDELAKAKEQNVRLLADFDNFRRRTIRESSETYQRASEAIFTELLPVVDNFERALSQAPAEGDAFADGVRMLHTQLVGILEKAGVVAIDAVGTDFNPNDHEAIAYQPSPDAPEGKVIYQTKRGYRMGDKVIRPAAVVVSSGAPATAPDKPGNDESNGANASEKTEENQ